MDVALTYSKSTKGTHVYEQSEPEDPQIPSIYIRRDAPIFQGGEVPKRIIISVKDGAKV